MKKMTLIEMDGFLKGKCIPSDLKVNETNAEYLVRKFGELESKLETALRECRSAGITIDNLEAKCAALAAQLANAEKRITELEAREVVLPSTQDVHPLGPHSAKIFCEFHRNIINRCADEIRKAGVNVSIKGE